MTYIYKYTIIYTHILTILSVISSGILSGILFDIPSGIRSGILSHDLSEIVFPFWFQGPELRGSRGVSGGFHKATHADFAFFSKPN